MAVNRKSRLLFAVALLVTGFFLTQLPLSAQQSDPAVTPPAPPPAGSPLAGRPLTEGAMRPAPIPADQLPISKLKAPRGFKIELYAAGVDNARTLRLGDKGTVFVSSRVR